MHVHSCTTMHRVTNQKKTNLRLIEMLVLMLLVCGTGAGCNDDGGDCGAGYGVWAIQSAGCEQI